MSTREQQLEEELSRALSTLEGWYAGNASCQVGTPKTKDANWRVAMQDETGESINRIKQILK